MQNAVGVGIELGRKNKLGGLNSSTLFIAISAVMLTIAVAVSILDVPLTLSSGCAAKNMYVTEKNVKLSPQSEQLYKIEFAKTYSQQELGLSERPCFPKDGALVFLFPTDDTFGIWMKDMKFAIDVLWLDKDKKVVHIVENMDPKSYPTVYYPPTDARYVIEVNAGQAKSVLKAEIGQQFNW